MDVLSQIQKKYPSFKKIRRKIADYVLENPEKCSFYSLREFSQRTNAAEVTILNFCRALGYQNYLDFKQGLQEDLMNKVGVRDRIRMTYGGCASAENLYKQIVGSARQIADATFERNSAETIRQFAYKVATAKHLFLVAHNVTQEPAAALFCRLQCFGMDAHFLDIEDNEATFNLLTMWPAEDCLLVALGISPVGQSTLAVSGFCQSLGMEILSITDKETSQLAQRSSVSLICSVRIMDIYNSTATLFLMLDVLTVFLSAELDKLPPRTEQVPQNLEALRQKFEEYNTLI